jgi:NTP pyrophosphatase (non-canonical NTP hydrolase)
MEECGELSQATNKVWRLTRELSTDPGKAKEYVASENNLVEEIADVSIMISQIQEILGINNERIAEQVDIKLDREIKRIQKGGVTYQ